MIKNKKTAIYLRLSVEEDGPEASWEKESGSITGQRMYLLEYIEKDSRLAGSAVLEFCDDGFSGRNMERPGMQEMLKQVRQGRIGCILVKDMSRFSRDYIEMGTYLNQIFPFIGIDFIAVNDGYDSREHGGGAIALDTAFQTLLYDFYSKDISVKVKASFDSKCANGEYVFGQVPFGYQKSREVKNKVVVNEKEAAIVRLIFSMAAEGAGSTEIARWLVKERIPTATQIRYPNRKQMKENHTWSSEMVRNILKNRFYLGEMSYGKSMRRSAGSRERDAVPENEWKVVRKHHEPLVTEEVFARVSRTGSGYSTKRKREKHPLTGRIYCGGCGYSLNYKPGRKNIPPHFWCRKHAVLQIPDCCTYMNASVLEEIVLMFLKCELLRRGDLLKEETFLQRFRQDLMERLAVRIREYRKQYHEKQKEKDSLYENYADGRISAKEYRDGADRLAEQLGRLSDLINAAETEYNRTEEESYKDRQNMEQMIRCCRLEKLTQEAVDVFIRKVTVYKDKRVEIAWNFLE